MKQLLIGLLLLFSMSAIAGKSHTVTGKIRKCAVEHDRSGLALFNHGWSLPYYCIKNLSIIRRANKDRFYQLSFGEIGDTSMTKWAKNNVGKTATVTYTTRHESWPSKVCRGCKYVEGSLQKIVTNKKGKKTIVYSQEGDLVTEDYITFLSESLSLSYTSWRDKLMNYEALNNMNRVTEKVKRDFKIQANQLADMLFERVLNNNEDGLNHRNIFVVYGLYRLVTKILINNNIDDQLENILGYLNNNISGPGEDVDMISFEFARLLVLKDMPSLIPFDTIQKLKNNQQLVIDQARDRVERTNSYKQDYVYAVKDMAYLGDEDSVIELRELAQSSELAESVLRTFDSKKASLTNNPDGQLLKIESFLL